jgi:hypothetical protein
MLDHKDTVFWTVSVWTYGRVEIQFEMMKGRPIYEDEQKRLDMLIQINRALGTQFPLDAINRRPTLSLSDLSEPSRLGALLAVIDGYLDDLKSSY